MGEPHRKSISELALWMEGLGIQVIFHRPRRPTDNSKVERIQQTSAKWIELENIKSITELEKVLKRISTRHIYT